MLASKEQLPGASAVKTEAPVSEMYMEMYCKTSIDATIKNRRRFSDEQIKSLQFMFDAESRPEPQMKEQLANQLGLQPRQVAIWFQNKRARSKSKQMMLDYCVLKANYHTLASDVESLKRENHLLNAQLQELKDLWEQSQKSKQAGKNNNNADGMFESKDKLEITTVSRDLKMDVLQDDESRRTVKSVKQDTAEPNMMEKRENTLLSSGKWCSLESNSFFGESSCPSHWWGFWP